MCCCLYKLSKRYTCNSIQYSSFILISIFYFPIENEQFDREVFNALPWHSKCGKILSSGDGKFVEITNPDNYCEMETNLAGGFQIYFTFEDE